MSDSLGEWDEEAVEEDAALRRFANELADAEGALRVAQAKASDVFADEKKAEWQRLASEEGAEKARRARDRAAADLDEARIAVIEMPADASDEPGPAEEQEQPYYGSVDEFYREYLRHMYSREVGGRGSGRVWRADWWRVPEAIARLEALWRAWEQLRLDAGTGASVWWRDHADHHMSVLMDPEGPFLGSESKCGRGEPLPYEPPPEGLFPDEREPAPQQV